MKYPSNSLFASRIQARSVWIGCYSNFVRQNRKKTLTPKGEAEIALRDTRRKLSELRKFVHPREESRFVAAFNDFLRCGRSVTTFLALESKRPGIEGWTKAEDQRLQSSDPRYSHFVGLRNISTHDCIVRPDVTVADAPQDARISRRNDVGFTMRDQHEFGSSNAENVIASELSVKYFLQSWQAEDLLAYAREITNTLEGFVQRGHAAFP